MDDPKPDETEGGEGIWWAMAAYGVVFTLIGIGLAVWDARAESGDVNDIFDAVGIAMALSGVLVAGTGWHAATRRRSILLLAAVFFLHVGPLFTFGIYAIIFTLVT